MKYGVAICLLLTAFWTSAVLAQEENHTGPPEGIGPPEGAGPPDGIGPPDGAGPPDGVGPPDGAGPPWGIGPPGIVGTMIPEHAGPPGFVRLLHCGCNADATGMEFVEITVTTRSRGHLNHVSGSIDSCAPEGSDLFLDFVREMSDCQLEGDMIGDAIAPCNGQEAGQSCGAPNGDEG